MLCSILCLVGASLVGRDRGGRVDQVQVGIGGLTGLDSRSDQSPGLLRFAADVAGYSHHTEVDEEASTATLRMYRAVVEELISAHRGHIFSSAGDGVVAEFPSVVEAIRCGVEI